MARTIKLSDIKWASNTAIDSKPLEKFIQSLCLFVGELLRSDEIGLIVVQYHSILMVRISKVDFNTEENHIELINFEGSTLAILMSKLNLNHPSSNLIASNFEVFCYRPKPNKPYHPTMYPTYTMARERASRILNGIFTVIVNADKGCFVSYAYVDEKAATKFFQKISKHNELQYAEISNFAFTVDKWIGEVYNDALGSKQYKTKNRYPIAPRPLYCDLLPVLTSDDENNFMAYLSKLEAMKP